MGNRWLAVVVAAALAGSACANDRPAVQTSPVSGPTGVARIVYPVPSPSLDDAGDTDPESVINAASLLWSDGDVDRALVDGIFTRAELDAARAGLADGSLGYLFD